MCQGGAHKMENKTPDYLNDVEVCVDQIIKKVGKDIKYGIPLGLGKPVQLTNALYNRAKKDPEIKLHILTALILEVPSGSSELENRIVGPMASRIFGDFPNMDFMDDLRKGEIPANIMISEFYTKSGSILKIKHAQHNYICSNYTHIARDTANLGLNVVAQIVAKQEMGDNVQYSLSGNSDTSIESVSLLRKEQAENGRKIAVVGQVNSNLPFMYGDAVRDADTFDIIIDNPQYDHQLFSVPKAPIKTDEYMIGLNASTLVKDNGTLQIGIGALGDAIAAGLQMRHDHNNMYCSALKDAEILKNSGETIEQVGGTEIFEKGLNGSSEMLVDGFLDLHKSGIVKRKTYENLSIQKLINAGKIQDEISPDILSVLLSENVISAELSQENMDFLKEFGIFKEAVEFKEGKIILGDNCFSTDLSDAENLKQISAECLGEKLSNGILMYGAFFVGPQRFYDTLNAMSSEERQQIFMTGVSCVNQLYGNEELRKLQRINGRFINAGMKLSLLGAVASDGLDDGQVVSGVGGQYNFVSMAHALEDGRSIMMIKSTRQKGHETSSNIVFNYGHVTIPRHLRDIFVTEYGIADVRGKSDWEVIALILNITDSRFQQELLDQAKKAGKICEKYQIPAEFCHNHPDKLNAILAPYREQGYFPQFPLGQDVTDEEITLIGSLRGFKDDIAIKKFSFKNLIKALVSVPDNTKPFLKRMKLDQPGSLKESILQKVVVYALLTGKLLK